MWFLWRLDLHRHHYQRAVGGVQRAQDSHSSHASGAGRTRACTVPTSVCPSICPVSSCPFLLQHKFPFSFLGFGAAREAQSIKKSQFFEGRKLNVGFSRKILSHAREEIFLGGTPANFFEKMWLGRIYFSRERRGQFHQRSTSSFYSRRSQKRKKAA